MFFSLKGKIIYKDIETKFVVIENNDIGYQVFVLLNFFKKINLNEEIKIFTYFHHKEDTQELYGFERIQELEFFKKLLSVNGVGPKSALGILKQSKVENIKKAIINEELDTLIKVVGIGRKMAQKIILELKNKIQDELETKDTKTEFSNDSYVLDALKSLGYSVSEARQAVQEIPDSIIQTQEKVKFVLKKLGSTLGNRN
ncbi:Holliday junction branch migration protein RuvA [Candidatus Kuenenbacteria bacterium HGW-Kuenenbacteria-1]|uniref:Holliday junction branch migration complex subunit RuvA n=1 Tax=Candidatus Kuenenbacteria bacterium HGW-Kuenenbacteria-1 TaxID=2013812 RepID=A0A2N1UPI8_9BACT|nr:MAG: Holliday junction branch migration protein RuvA [Candidatus Kuenenbacteria bacterium HGW-Kuenenbacteria-1]